MRCAVAGCRVGSSCATARLVGQFPPQDRGVVLVLQAGIGVGAIQQVGDPVFVPFPDGRIGVELVVILPSEPAHILDRKSTRLNSSHSQISYAVFCLKKKKYLRITPRTHTSLLRLCNSNS